MRSVTVGTSTSAVLTASASWPCVIGLSSGLSRASKSSRMRSSTLSGSLRVTMTSGFLLFGMCSQLRRWRRIPPGSADSALFNRARPHCAQRVAGSKIRSFSYQMAVTTQSFRAALAAGRGRVWPPALLAVRAHGVRLGRRRCRDRLGERPAGAALRQPQVRPGQCARPARTRTRTCAGSIPAPACRWRSPPNSRTGGASATGKARKAGSITRCCRASARRWSCRSERTNWCRSTKVADVEFAR